MQSVGHLTAVPASIRLSETSSDTPLIDAFRENHSNSSHDTSDVLQRHWCTCSCAVMQVLKFLKNRCFKVEEKAGV